MDFLSFDATEQLAALSKRQISARELLDLSVQRADALNPRLNAIVARDMQSAAGEAQAIGDRRARGESPGPLAGLPMTVKDHFDIDGFPSSFGGDASLLQRKGVKDAEIIRKVRAAGAIVRGHTNQVTYGGDLQAHNKLYGTTKIPGPRLGHQADRLVERWLRSPPA
jgi:amidase